ncbi:PEGA domain-containing protein [Treponema pedis]|uniref:PEGA domain-containing protein n=1 Tax=Treponema pedis TaxID=409322 RepID=UPI00041A23CB|nr:PEGA domain-containing protein [Treponema pedis]
MSVKCIFKFILFFSFPCFLIAREAGAEKDEWVIAVSEFETESVAQSYQNYKTIIPEMFLIYLDTGAKRLVPFEEKKMRAVTSASNKRLSLIKERAKLISERDSLFLSAEDVKIKEKKEKKLNGEIEKKEKEIFYSRADIAIQENKFFQKDSVKNVVLWKQGQALYKLSGNAVSSETLAKENISALIYGTVKDISGYMVIKVKLDTGLIGMPVHEFSDAGRYEDVEQIVQALAYQIYTVIQNAKEIKVFFDVTPKEAKLYIDNKAVTDFSKPIALHAGKYTVSASAENYAEASKEIIIENQEAYTLKINLQKDGQTKIGFNLAEKTPHVFFKTQYSATVPGIITIPRVKTILEFNNGGVHTFGLFDPEKTGRNNLNRDLSPEYVQSMIVDLNKKNTKDSIELHRKILYWSLAAFYVSLPVTMILKSRLDDKIQSFKEGKFPLTQDKVNEINKFGYIQQGFQWVTVALGVNYFIQLIIYLVKADRALPRQIKPDIVTPEYKVKEKLNTNENKTEIKQDEQE